jgi:Flp pilus assembly protein TadG
MVSAKRKNIWRDESGAALIEFTAAVFTFFIILFGVVEFANVFYQWNAATKAVQLGARLAAVSDPVSSDLLTLTGMEDGALPGATMPAFDRVCNSDSITGATGACTGGIYDATSAAAMQTIVFGRCQTGVDCPRTTCVGSGANIGMCNIFTRVTPLNVSVRYQYTGLGYAGRPGGPVPTITVSLIGTTPLTYDFILIGGLAGLSSMQLPSFATTVTGEDLNVSGS